MQARGEARADVLVVGAGLSGLRAADRLRAAGRDVHVIEARDRVGGRTWSGPLGHDRFDFGGQWVGPGQPRMYALLDELGIATYPTHDEGKKVLDLGDRVRTYSGTIPRLSPLELVRLQLLLSRLDRLTGGVDGVEPWESANAPEYDERTVQGWVQQQVKSPNLRGLLAAASRTVFGAELGELSLLHFLFYLRNNGGFMRLIETRGGYQQDRIVGGAQQIGERLADRIGIERVHLSEPVREIRRGPNEVTVRTDRGERVARRVVLALPPHLAGRIEFTPGLPTLRRQLHQRAPMGATVKCFALYERPFWRDAGLSGEAVALQGPVATCFDNSTPSDKQACLLGFVVGRPGRGFSERPEQLRKQSVIDAFTRWFGPDAANPTAYHEVDWATEPWTEGCPIANFAPGTLSTFGRALRAPIDGLHFAGTETAAEGTGYMEGALEAGERAADEVLAALR